MGVVKLEKGFTLLHNLFKGCLIRTKLGLVFLPIGNTYAWVGGCKKCEDVVGEKWFYNFYALVEVEKLF